MSLQRKLVLAVSVVIAIALWLLWREPPVVVDIARVDSGPLRVEVREEGFTRVRDLYTLAAPVGGRLLRPLLRPGDAVIAGQTTVLTMAPATAGLLDARAHEQARAALGAAQAALDYASQELRRVEQLARSGQAPAAAVDAALLQREQARAAVTTAQAALMSGNIDGGDLLSLTSPVNGVVIAVYENSERPLAAGTPVLSVGDLDQLEVVVELLSADAVRVAAGAPVRLTGWGGDAVLSGQLRRIEPQGYTKVSALGVDEQRVRVLIDVPPGDGRRAGLGHGYRVQAAITVWSVDEVLRVPVTALYRDHGAWSVYVVAGGRVQPRALEIGPRNDRHAQVLSGLRAAESVVLFPDEQLLPGIAVRPLARP